MAGTATLTDVEISGNAAQYGGGIHVDGDATLTLTDSTLANNGATSHGGALCFDGRGTVENCGFTENGAQYGGGIHVGNSGALTVVGAEIVANTASVSGGGIDVGGDATLTLTDSLVDGNKATSETGGAYGGVAVAGTATLTNCAITGNVGGGAFVKQGATATLTACVVSENTASGDGGGLYVKGFAELNGCEIIGNAAGYGGGLSVFGSATLVDCKISGNAAT